MAEPEARQQEEEISSAAGPGAVHQLWHGCALLGLILVFLIEILLVPLVPEGDNSVIIEIAGVIDEIARSIHRHMPVVDRLLGSPDYVGYTFVDVDNETFAEWRTSDDHTRRSKIKELIKKIAGIDNGGAHKPQAIVVDINLSGLSSDKDGEDKLKEYVKTYQKPNPPLIFVQSLGQSHEEKKQSERQKEQSEPYERVPLDISESLLIDTKTGEPVFQSQSPIYFASAGFLQSLDGYVRSWLLAEPACKKGPGDKQRLETIPSVQLLLLPTAPDGKPHPDVVNEKVKNAYVGDCHSVITTVHEIQLGEDKDVLVRLSSKHLRDPIVYKMNWPPGWLPNRTLNKWSGLLYYRRAKDALAATDGKDRFSGRIVVIGGSNDKSQDSYNTPYGRMPGALVLINAIESFRIYHQLSGLRGRVEMAIGIIIGITVWLLLESRRWKMRYVWFIGCALAIIVSSALLYFGIWFSIAGVFAGVSAHLLSKLACDRRKYLQNWGHALLAKKS
jgi:hypothetical protein